MTNNTIQKVCSVYDNSMFCGGRDLSLFIRRASRNDSLIRLEHQIHMTSLSFTFYTSIARKAGPSGRAV
jgi:hypothetical protein